MRANKAQDESKRPNYLNPLIGRFYRNTAYRFTQSELVEPSPVSHLAVNRDIEFSF